MRRKALLATITAKDEGPLIDNYNYLTIVALEDGLTASLSKNACEYCIDFDDNWMPLDAGVNTQSINTGHKLSFRGQLNSNNGIGTFTINKRCNIQGNCMSMLFGAGASTSTTINRSYAFSGLFKNCSTIVRVSSTFLPATTLKERCYHNMFSGCTSLISAPKLPATSLAIECYLSMFSGCTRLTSAPELPATNLESGCYNSMFYECASLTSAPKLPAMTLANSCYSSMFYGCSSLTTAPELPAMTLAQSCYGSMFYSCPKLKNPPALPATSLSPYCYGYMFTGCTSLTVAPELPATTLASYCYYYMFRNCINLENAPILPATTLATYCYNYMFVGCRKLNYIKMLATNISASQCLSNWVSGVASTGTFVKNPDATWEVYGNSGIPNGWTVKFDGEEENNTFEFPIYLEIDEYDFNTGGGANGYINNSKSPDFYSNLYSYLIQILKTYGDAYIGGWNLPNILDYGIEIYVHKSTGWVLIEEIDYYESDNAIYGWCWSDYCEISFSNAAYIKWFDKL